MLFKDTLGAVLSLGAAALLAIGHLAPGVQAAALPVPGCLEPSSASIEQDHASSDRQDALAQRDQPTCPTDDPYCCFLHGGCEDSSTGSDAVQSVPAIRDGKQSIKNHLLTWSKRDLIEAIAIRQRDDLSQRASDPCRGSNDPYCCEVYHCDLPLEEKATIEGLPATKHVKQALEKSALSLAIRDLVNYRRVVELASGSFSSDGRPPDEPSPPCHFWKPGCLSRSLDDHDDTMMRFSHDAGVSNRQSGESSISHHVRAPSAVEALESFGCNDQGGQECAILADYPLSKILTREDGKDSLPFDPIGGSTIGRDLLPPGKGNVLPPSGPRVGISKEGHKRGEIIGGGHGSNDPISSGGPIGVGKKHKTSASSLPEPRSDDPVGSDPIIIGQKQHHHRDSLFKDSQSGQLVSRG